METRLSILVVRLEYTTHKVHVTTEVILSMAFIHPSFGRAKETWHSLCEPDTIKRTFFSLQDCPPTPGEKRQQNFNEIARLSRAFHAGRPRRIEG